MKNIAIILLAVIGFTFAACEDPGNSSPSAGTLTGKVRIEGKPQVGEVLQADTSLLGFSLASGDVYFGLDFFFEWKRNGNVAIGDNDTSYFVESADMGCTITVTVTVTAYTFSGNVLSGKSTSNPIGPITEMPPLSGMVRISGTPEVGQYLWVDTSDLNLNDDEWYNYLFEWNLSEYTSSYPTFYLNDFSVGCTFAVTVTVDGYSGSVTSEPVGPVVPGKINARDPVISSITARDTIVTVNTWSSLDVQIWGYIYGGEGMFSCQWYRNTSESNTGGDAITGATDFIFSQYNDTVGTFYYFAEVTHTIPDNGDGGDKTATVRSDVVEVHVLPSGEIGIYLTGTDEQIIPVPADSDRILTVPGTYTAYRWYLDDALVGGSSKYTFNQPEGTYQLVVVVTDNEGGSRLVRCRVIAAPLLTDGVWANGNITDADGENWYAFPVTEGTEYYLLWNDRENDIAGGRKGYIAVGARYENTTTFLSLYILGGTRFSATQTGTVYIRVIPYERSSNNTGVYNIAYTATSSVRSRIYWVYFNANEGSGTPPVSQYVNQGSSIIFPDGSGLSRDGYTFGGWNTRADGTGTNYNAGSSYTPNSQEGFYARWHTHYTVTFNINDGSGTTPAAQTGSAISPITFPDGNGFSRSGHIFGGWNTRADGTGTNYSPGDSYIPTTNMTLYARWSINFEVTFNTNNGSGATPPAQTATPANNGVITLPSGSGLSRDGYAFGGWNTKADGTGTNYIAGSAYTPTTNITLYVRWHAIYTVTFDANGGSGTTPAAQTGSAITSITLPSGNGLSRDGYTFGGWNTNSSGTGTNYNAGALYTPTDNRTLYARWYRFYTVSFDTNGGIGTKPVTQTGSAGSGITLPLGSGLSKSGCAFGGWNTNSSGTGTSYNAGSAYTPTGDITLYARWHTLTPLSSAVWADGDITNANDENWYSLSVTQGQTYYIWWNDRGEGDGSKNGNVAVSARYDNADTFIFGGNDNTVNNGFTTAQIFTANRTGAVYIRVIPLIRSSSYTGTYGIMYNTSGASPVIRTVTFDPNGGSGTTPAQTFIDGQSITLPGGIGLSRTGYTFGGWNTSSSGTGTNYDAGSSYTPGGNTTLYARWYSTVTFNINGGSGTLPAARTVNAGASITLPNGSGFSRDGYTFLGWNINTIAYAAGSSYTPTGNITIYARWNSNSFPCTVSFDRNGGSGTTPSSQRVNNAGDYITLPSGNGLSRTGYTFGGWNTLANGTGTNYPAGYSFLPAGNMTLYARWIVNCTVTFNINGGLGITPSSQTGPTGSGIILPERSGFFRFDYIFYGWNTRADGMGTNYDAGSLYTLQGNVTLYARWQ
jgi:uncharacterized repeat protein (TIGR02543 family)